ncbi:WIF domain [Popillia japonica]|uniref:receptor protein-tyrosine kinase n=1 Tax=Popillia japonica TaxID=7064 RepID=A0AAW1NKL4_POPJA
MHNCDFRKHKQVFREVDYAFPCDVSQLAFDKGRHQKGDEKIKEKECVLATNCVNEVKQLPYILSVNYDNQGVMLPPQMNISTTGVIPTSVQTFRVKLLCTGQKSAEVQVQLQLNVSAHNRLQNETSLKFRRNKICLKGIGPPLDSIKLDPEGLSSSTNSLYIAAACSIAMITLVVFTTSAVCIKSKKLSSQEPHYISAVYDNNQHVFVRLDSANGRTPSAGSGSYATIASIHKSPPSPSPYATTDALRVSYYASSQIILLSQMPLQDPHLCDPTERLRSLSIPRTNISTGDLAQEGTFGQIYYGTLATQETVVIKTVSEAASKLQISLFLTEGTMMYGIMHKNILPIIAANIDMLRKPLLVYPYINRGKNILPIIAANIDMLRKPLLVYPYINRGNLKRFLTKCRQRDIEQYALSTRNLVEIGIQITLGITYLHSQCLCHKDIATRNCVIDDKLQVKITDSALSRDLFPDDYCCLYDNENRPVKWLAIETLLHKQFTAASDLWSFGVLLWELTTLAQQPYPDIDFFEMVNYLETGYRLQQPLSCPDELFSVMKCCWFANPLERPTFAQLLTYLQDFHRTLGKYI